MAAATATETSTEAAAAGGAPAREKASDWFAPRKSGAPGGGSTNGAGLPGGSGPTGPAAPQGAGTLGGTGAGGTRPGAQGAPGGKGPGVSGGANGTGPLGAAGGARPGGANAPRPGSGGTNGAGLPGATGAGPVAPGHGGGTGSFDVSAALGNTAAFPAIGSEGPGGPGGPGRPGGPGGEPRRDDLPYFAENFSGNGLGGPSGPTGGPVTGDGPLVPPTGPGAAPGSLAARPGGPGSGYPGGGLSDDTAILTPQKPAPEPGGQGYGGPGDNVSGHTLTSGIPVVPGAQNSPFGPGARSDGPLPHTPPKAPEPAPKPAASSKKPAKKKGRSKLTLLVVGVVFIGGGVYGAGLLMNRSDVPKGTTVLGVDIGGGTRDEAVKKLDDAFGAHSHQALKLSVDGTTVSLKPDQAGLQLDTQDTVRSAAGSDYNPISVIGSLFGQQRVVDPKMPVDEEKLQAALQDAAGGSGSAGDGTIKFEAGKAVAVYGKAGKGIDVGASMQAVEAAYRAQVETGTTTPVKVATTTRQSTVSNAEVDRMMKEFAEPAMSGIVIVQTDAAHRIRFGALSLPKILGVKAVDGKLVETYDLKALKEAYGSTFDGVQIETATGKRGVLPQDVVSALRKALRGKTTAERIGVIDTKPS